jgi:uncharacterized protein (TIGR02594 family)
MSEPKWLQLARGYLGLKELKGPKHNPEILKWFEESGHGWIKDDETAWCAAFANAMLERADVKGTNSVAARSFMQWGKELKEPEPGCLVVLWRGSKNSWQGHVGFFISESAEYVKVLGGNQNNAVSIANYPKSQLLGYRWPATLSRSRTVAGAGGAAVGGAGVLAEPVVETVNTIAEQQYQFTTGNIILIVLGALIVAGACYALFARWDDAGRPKLW